MLKVAIKNDFRKVRKYIWVLIIGFPVMAILMQGLNYTSRYDYLIGLNDDYWGFLLINLQFYWPSVSILLMTLVCSSIIGVEYQHNMWEKQFSLPINKSIIYTSKVLINIILIMMSNFLAFVLIILLGIYLDFNLGSLSIYELLVLSFGTFLTLLPLFVILLAISFLIENAAFTLTIGIASATIVMYTYGLPDIFPLQWPHFKDGFHNGTDNMIKGLVLGVLEFCLLFLLLKYKIHLGKGR